MAGKKKYNREGLEGMLLPSQSDTVSQMPAGFGTLHQDIRPLDNEDMARAKEEQEANAPSILGLPKAVLENTWVEPALYRASERNAASRDFQDDPEFKVTDEQLDKLPTLYSAENKIYLKESKSPAEFAARQRWVDEDLERNRHLAAYGYKGAFASFVGSLLDPAMLPLMIATGGEGVLASGTRLGKMARTGAAFATQAGITEGAMLAGDTQKTGKDVLHAIAVGGVLGTGLGSLGKLKVPAAEVPHPSATLLDGVNSSLMKEAKGVLERDVDLDLPTFLRKQRELPVGPPDPNAAVANDVVDAAEGAARVFRPAPREPSDVITAADINTRHPELAGRLKVEGADAHYPGEAPLYDGDINTHPPAPEFVTKVTERTGLKWDEINDSIAEHVKDLTRKGKQMLTGRTGAALRKELEAKAASIKNDLAEMVDTMTRHRSVVAAAHGAPDSADALARLQYRLHNIEQIYKPSIDAAEKRLAEVQGRLDAAKAAKGHNSELEEFKKMSRAEQIHKLYPEGAPTVKNRIETQHRVLDDLTPTIEAEDRKAAADFVEHLDPADPMAEAGEMFDIFTGKKVKMPKEKVSRVRQAEGGSEAAPAVASETSEPLPAVHSAEREARVQAATLKSSTGMSTPDFLRTFISKAAQVGRSTIHWVPTKYLQDRLEGLYTILDSSENQAFRGLNIALHESSQGGITPEQTADAFHQTFLHQIRSAERNRWNEGFKQWSAEQGRGVVQAILDVGNHKAEFNKEVFLKVVDPSREVSEGVALAAEGHRDALSMALAIRKRAGEEGFADITDSRAYMPIIFESPSIVHFAATRGEEDVIATISKAYQEGRFHLAPKAADKLAEMQFRRARAHQLSGSQVFKNVVAESERPAFIKSLVDSGVPEDVVRGFLEDQENTQLMENISNRAKFSLGLNPSTEHNGIRMIDMLYSDTAQLTQNYYRESAGGAALAMKGFRSFEHANRVVNLAEEVGLKSGVNVKRNQEEAQLLRDSLKMMYGHPIDQNPNGVFEVTARRTMSLAATRALGMMGFAQFPETARAISHLGLGEVLRQIPAVSIFRREAARGGSSTGALLDPVMREVEHALGYQGEDSWFPRHIRVEGPSIADTSGRLGRVMDNGLALGANVNNIASGFQFTQGGAEKIVMRSISQKLSKMAHGEMPFPEALAREVGWDREFLNRLSDHVQANPLVDTFRGQQVKLLNMAAMDNEMLDTLLIGMNRMKARIIQREFIGDTNPFMSTTVGRVLSQFKRFSIISVEKQLIHDLRGDKITAAQTLAWSTLLGYMAYSARAHLKALGSSNPDVELDKYMNDRAVALGTFNMMPQMAGLSLAGDFMGTIGLLPDDWAAAPGRAGVHPMSGANLAPAAGVVADGVKFTHSLVKLLDGNGDAAKSAKYARGLIPLANTIGVGQLIDKAMP